MSMGFCNSCRGFTASRPMVNICVPRENPGCVLNGQNDDSEREDFRQSERRTTGRRPRSTRPPSIPNSTRSTQILPSVGGSTGYPQYMQGVYGELGQGGYAPYASGTAGIGLDQSPNQWQPGAQTAGTGKFQTLTTTQGPSPFSVTPSIEPFDSGAFAQGYNQLQTWQSANPSLYAEPLPLDPSVVSRDSFTPIDDSRSMLAAHWKQSRQETSKDESDQIVDNDGREPGSRYPCPHGGCPVTYVNKNLLDAHMRKDHTPTQTRFDCEDSSCPSKGIHGFARRSGMLRHMRDLHPTTATALNAVSYHCPQPGCDRVYTRNGNLRHHLEYFHNIQVPLKKRGPPVGSTYTPRKRPTEEARSLQPRALQPRPPATAAEMMIPGGNILSLGDPNLSYGAGDSAQNTQPVGSLPGVIDARGFRHRSESEQGLSRQTNQRKSSTHSNMSISSGQSPVEGPSRTNTGESLRPAPQDMLSRYNTGDKEMLRAATSQMQAASLEKDQRGRENIRRVEYSANGQSQRTSSNSNVGKKNPEPKKRGYFK